MDNKNIENKFKNLSENDIKAINGFVDFFSGITNSNMEKFKIPVEITLNDENIIKGYKNLEKKNKRYKKYLRNKDIEHKKVLKYIETEKEIDYIPKSKVREKIEELEKLREALTDSDGFIELSASIDTLKELLEEK